MRYRQLLLLGLSAAFVWVILQRFSDLQNLTHTLAKGQWQWIAAAFGLQFVYYSFYTLLYQAAFRTVGIRTMFGELLPLTYASIFVNSTAPSGGTAGAALFTEDLRRQGKPVTRAATGTLLVLIADYSTFCMVLLVGLGALFLYHSLEGYQLISALIMFVAVMALLAALLVGLRRPRWLYHFFESIENLINHVGGWFRHPQLLAEDWSDRNAGEFIESAQSMARRRWHLFTTFALGLMTHTVNVVILYALFWAFEQPVTFGVLIAGYSMTMLFMIVSPTPNGIGIVETLLPTIYVSLGLPLAESAVISFAFRGFTFWIPLMIGFVLLRRSKAFTRSEQTLAETGDVSLIAILTTVIGIVNVISGSTPALSERLQWLAYFSPLSMSHGGHLTSVLSGFALMLLSQQLWQRKRSAWFLTVIVLSFSVVVHLVKGLDYQEATLAAVLAGYLISQRRLFYAIANPPSLLHGFYVLMTAITFTLSYGAVGFYLLEHHFATVYSLDAGLHQTVDLFIRFGNPGVEPISDFGIFFASSIYFVGLFTVGYALFTLLQPFFSAMPLSNARQRYAQAIVERFGRSSLAHLALLSDKRFYFSTGGSLIPYAIHQHTAVVLGDPIGPPEDVYEAIQSFTTLCQKRKWQTAFILTSGDFLEAYHHCGFVSLGVGYEAIIDLKTPLRAGHINEQVRSVVETLRRQGYECRLHAPPLNDALLQELRTVNEEWLAKTHNRERRFLFGWFDDPYIRNSPTYALHAPDGAIIAFTTLLPAYQRNEVSCDLVRWRVQTNRGILDQSISDESIRLLLFASLLEWAQLQGYDTFNLGLSNVPGAGETIEDPALADGVRYVAERIQQLYSFRGDYAFKQQFQPEWSARYLIFTSANILPGIAQTLNRAINSDDFMLDTVNGLVERLRRPRPHPSPPLLLPPRR